MKDDASTSGTGIAPTDKLSCFYARQSQLIDAGNHEAWANTFSTDGEFHSPTYPEPAIGHDALTNISRSFASSANNAGAVHRHVVTNLWVQNCTTNTANVRAYLQVIASTEDEVRILRIITLYDELIYNGSSWLVSYRHVDHGTTSHLNTTT